MALVALGAAAVGVLAFFALERASGHSFGGNSDGATVVLEGLSISHGHLALNGWDLSFDSFWSVDALVYAAVIAVTGLRHDLLHVVPALIALAMIGFGAWAAIGRRRGLAALCPLLLLLSVLAVPNPELSFFLLQGPWHIGTALWCLIAFVGVSRHRFGWVVAVLFLAAGLLGDLQTLLLGVLPCLFAGLLAMVRTRSLRAGVPPVGAAVAAAGLALAVRVATVRIGTYAIAHSATKARPAQYPANLHHVLTWGAGLFGVGWIPIGPSNALSGNEQQALSAPEQVLHALLLAIVVAGILLAVASLVFGLVKGRQLLADQDEEAYRLDDLLLLGLAGSLALFIYLCPNGNGDYARYLTPAVLFGTILAARLLARLLAGHDRKAVVGGAMAGLVLLGALASVGFVEEIREPSAAPQPAAQLGAFLEAHHLTQGIGDYWSASLVTVVTDGRVAVRPVIVNSAGELQRYGRQSDVAWYAGKRFQFFVYDLARPWRGVDSESATTSFGPPAQSYSVGTYRILTWPVGVTVSPVGYSRS